MLQLIRKDIILQKYTLLVMLPILLLYLTLNYSVVWIGIIFCIAIIMQSFSVDEKSTSHMLLNALPYTREEIVNSKYIGAGVFTFLILFIIFLGNLIINKEIIQWKQLFLIMSIVALFVSFAFPFSYLFKSQYLLFGGIALFVFYIVTVSKFIPDLNDRIRKVVGIVLSFEQSLVYVGGLVLVGLLYLFSWMISISIYNRKVF